MKQANLFKPTQCQEILAHLRCGKSIHQIEAMNKYGCMRLAGHNITYRKVKDRRGKTYASYSLATTN